MSLTPTLIVSSENDEVIDLLTAMLAHRYTVVVQDSSKIPDIVRTNGVHSYYAVLVDAEPEKEAGARTLQQIREADPTLQIIVVAAPTPATVVAAMKNGASDFLAKPFTMLDVLDVLARAKPIGVGNSATAAASNPMMRRLHLGSSPKIRRITELFERIGPADVPVFIHGETGVGKEVFAREIHAHSPRADRIFLKLNCAALPSELVESELFGYERGAFTGAMQRKAGMFELADGGTLLLDEIGDMDFKLQAKLLQVLQDSTFQRIGGKDTVRVDVRIIAATHRNLEEAIANGTFREDLYYRLNVVAIEVPPLRERQCDIVPLAEFLMSKYMVPGMGPVSMSAELVRNLQSYPWPGNVRELENMIRRLVILQDEHAIIQVLQSKAMRMGAAPLPAVESRSEEPVRRGAHGEPVFERVRKAKAEAETQAILDALNQCRWNRKQAARTLAIDYKALLYKMKKLGIGEEAPEEASVPAVAERVFKMGGGAAG